ncbi:TPA: hypothetical protein MI881_27245 [Klebsiella pneumoniae]|nr:hypothetical protein [Klebsiella pneumoniae]HBY8393343.1 hypothetical protein [Klebsiella pneumoniae]HBY8420925.1 hypothetical protein [Klebsiella pneumoniae]HBY8476836.1 hypothetical protein [Klebsiella pneumoniae]
MFEPSTSSTLRGFLFLSITYPRIAYKTITSAVHPATQKTPKSAAPSHFRAHFPPLRFASSQKTGVKRRVFVVSSHLQPFIRNLLQITSQYRGGKGDFMQTRPISSRNRREYFLVKKQAFH